MYLDWTYIVIVLPAILFSMIASASVQSTFRKYQNQHNMRHITGAQAARYLLDQNGLNHIRVEGISGNLTDHYDPKAQVIRLSSGVYDSTSTAAVGVACHEAGHALQHAENYAPLRLRNAIIPVTNIGSKLAVPLIIIGLMLAYYSSAFALVAYAGVACFLLCVLFQLFTLPTEFDASGRALRCIESYGLLTDDECKGAKRVLTAAAMTYVAAMAVSLAQLLRFLILISNTQRRR